MRYLLILAMTVLPSAALAAGSEDPEPPAETETTTQCANGQLWDVAASLCVDPEADGIDNDARFAAVRELAYAGKPDEALRVLDSMTEGDSDRVLTYRGFVLRKAGRMDASFAAYDAALAQNPDNILARSYLGMAYLVTGQTDLAKTQLAEIAARGGAGSRAEQALKDAIEKGMITDY